MRSSREIRAYPVVVPLTMMLLIWGSYLSATIFGSVRGVVHDPQHKPVDDATVVLRQMNSSWSQTAATGQGGEFVFPSVAIGDYTITADKTGFATEQQSITVVSSSTPILHFQLKVAGPNETTTVTEQLDSFNVDTVTPTSMVNREDIVRTPGADQSNSLAMITEYVPGAYITHDMLHIRGGHQTSWLVDGVSIPNTNIGSNVGPQIDPKDIDYLEALRGSYEAEYGDRTFGIFNIVPRSGFERDNEGELVVSLGNFWQTNNQINFAGHQPVCLLCQRQWQPEQFGPATTSSANLPRLVQWLWRIRFPDLQRRCQESSPVGGPGTPGLLPNSLRSRS